MTNKLGIVYKRGHVLVIRCAVDRRKIRKYHGDRFYYTVVNIKNKKHCHLWQEEFKAAVSICNCAYKKQVPDKYPEWMTERIRRIM